VLVCHDPELIAWRPDFSSSGQSDPDWTLVRCRGERLTNALNWVDWSENPVQVELCEECGVDGCAAGGYVHVSRLDDMVLWTAPHVDPDDEFASHQYAPSRLIVRHETIAIPVTTWDEWRARFDLPAADTFPAAEL
jgi:hypothetical protein